MNEKEILLSNLDRIHTTEMGIERIKKNLGLIDEDAVEYCIKIIKDKDCIVTKKGKNWYAKLRNCEITVNRNSYTIITAHKKN
ncbi:DUF3781 domain-containing protein [Anaerofustis stercorihominis]|uniref:DUF3781 domain-containing protein n=1 Tax=Anaerofustis stercorihominis TaxID=214853 RepID=UPI00214B256B|nr:DUF3781 domain-containing protein [Anaerofustis stercorihominis]MCR2033649.1 DUF3781 domain-containing protein [Anaerofustis stercorihominis]